MKIPRETADMFLGLVLQELTKGMDCVDGEVDLGVLAHNMGFNLVTAVAMYAPTVNMEVEMTEAVVREISIGASAARRYGYVDDKIDWVVAEEEEDESPTVYH